MNKHSKLCSLAHGLRLSLGLLGVFMTLLCPAISAAPPDAPAGTLVLVGGGLKVDNVEILGAVRDTVSGMCAKESRERPRMAVIPSSFTDLAEARAAFERKGPDKHHEDPGYRTWLTNAGFSPILIPVTKDTVFRKDSSAEDPKIAALVESCQVVFLLGGDQGCHAICLLRRDKTPSRLLEAIRGVYRRGGVVMGTSAGTHVLANPMYGWGESGPTIVRGQLEKIDLAQVTPERGVQAGFPGNSVYLQGLGLLPPEVLTDTHFSIRGRLGRLVAGLRDTGMRWGLGVDENTALFLHDGQGIVRGEHGVFIVDTASATISSVGEPFRARDVRVSLLTSGDSWNPVDGTVVSSKPRVKPAIDVVAASDDIFSAKRTSDGERENPYATTIVMRDLINSCATFVDSRAHPAGSFVFVRFHKTDETWGAWTSPSSFTVVLMHLDIDRRPMAHPDTPTGSKIPAEPQTRIR
ncbi:MAG TPA: cyanophycinase [Candidatus Rifleibacterium sp.]|nr:cyanophycinase [Candidatus Rifleibacterium sp.]